MFKKFKKKKITLDPTQTAALHTSVGQHGDYLSHTLDAKHNPESPYTHPNIAARVATERLSLYYRLAFERALKEGYSADTDEVKKTLMVQQVEIREDLFNAVAAEINRVYGL